MRLIVALFGVSIGALVALGQMSAAQLQHIGQTLLALAAAYGLTLLPWLLTVLFAWLWWRQRQITDAFREGYLEKVLHPAAPRQKRAAR